MKLELFMSPRTILLAGQVNGLPLNAWCNYYYY